ncbi:MAG: chemotaxis protein CheZ [Gammaproteobacteria bacterium]|nr:MAG: chemotaxis protein CheZ [Gammaproteobacteria bacterium]
MQSNVQQGLDNNHIIGMIQQYAMLFKDGEGREAEIVLQNISQLYDETKLCLVNTQLHNKKDEKPHIDENLYSKVGKLTRDLNDSLNNFLNDASLETMTNDAMPDARQRLNYVIELTEKSAHETLSLIENSNPLIRMLGERATILLQQYKKHDACENKSDYLNDETKAFLHLVTSSAKTVNEDLNKIMLAQNYQDLTGQVINRVSTLVQEVENNLLVLLKFSSEHTTGNQSVNSVHADNTVSDKSDTKGKDDNRGFGPPIPGTSTDDVVESQEDVDDLLSSLGF